MIGEKGPGAPRNEAPRKEDEAAGRPTVSTLVPLLAREVAMLDPKPAAMLRRGPMSGAGAPVFWRMMARHRLDPRNTERWAVVVSAIAHLTPRGRDREERKSVHWPEMGMGAAMYFGGVSEMALARMLNSRVQRRDRIVLELCRRLAATEWHRFDLTTLAMLVLSGGGRVAHRISREYYRAEFGAREGGRKEQNQENRDD